MFRIICAIYVKCTEILIAEINVVEPLYLCNRILDEIVNMRGSSILMYNVIGHI